MFLEVVRRTMLDHLRALDERGCLDDSISAVRNSLFFPSDRARRGHTTILPCAICARNFSSVAGHRVEDPSALAQTLEGLKMELLGLQLEGAWLPDSHYYRRQKLGFVGQPFFKARGVESMVVKRMNDSRCVSSNSKESMIKL